MDEKATDLATQASQHTEEWLARRLEARWRVTNACLDALERFGGHRWWCLLPRCRCGWVATLNAILTAGQTEADAK